MRLTGSRVAHATRCAWPFRPDVPEDVRPDTDGQRLGRAVHAVIAECISSPDAMRDPWEAIVDAARKHDAPNDEITAHVDAWREWWSTRPLGDGPWQAEVAVTYDPERDAAATLSATERDYSQAQPGEIPGTIDALLVCEDRAIVVDWKCGEDWQHLTADADENAQIQFYALAAARAHAVDEAVGHIVRITPDGVRVSSVTLDALDLAAAANDLRALVEGLQGAAPQPGAHCARCPTIAACPAARRQSEALATHTPETLDLTTPEAAGVVYVALRTAEARLAAIKAALRQYGEDGGEIVTPEGERLAQREVATERLYVDGDRWLSAGPVLLEYGVIDAVESKRTLTKASIERVAKARGEKPAEAKRTAAAVVEALRAVGCVGTDTQRRWLPTK